MTSNVPVKLAIIVPYRNRLSQLTQFVEYFYEYFMDKKVPNTFEYEIIVIEQSDDSLKFNRGILLNIGFKIALDKGCNSFIYHDVDLLPNLKLLEEYYKLDLKNVVHIASSWTRYSGDPEYLGGITKIPGDIFIEAGGFPTKYWGWGSEDEEMKRRLELVKANIIRLKSNTEDITDLENMNITQKLANLNEFSLKGNVRKEITYFYNKFRYTEDFKKIDGLDLMIKGSIEDLNYKILDSKEYSKKHVTHMLVNISSDVKMIEERTGDILKIYSETKLFDKIVEDFYILNFTTKKFIDFLDMDLKEQDQKDKMNKMNKMNKIDTNHSISKNPLYPWFSQNIFHAGSRKQFIEYSGLKGKNDIDYDSVMLTYDYMSDIVKKGIYISIINNRLDVFLPFSNTEYRNSWGGNLRPPKSYKRGSIIDGKIFKLKKDTRDFNNSKSKNLKKYYEISNVIKDSTNVHDIVAFSIENEIDKLIFNKTFINKNIEEWYANGYFFRNTIYNDPNNKDKYLKVDEGDKSIYLILKFYTELLKSVNVPDCKFFVNARDLPILKKDFSNPYCRLFPTEALMKEEQKYIKKEYFKGKNEKKILKIFSGATSEEYSDIPMPTDDDIKSTMWTSENVVVESIPWSERKNAIIFRGSATGRFIDIYNERIQISYLSKIYPDIINAGLTGFNRRLKVIDDKCTCNYIDTRSLVNGKLFDITSDKSFKIEDLEKGFIDMKDQLSYKYTIDIKGHSAAYRLPRLLSLGFVVLKVSSEWHMWSEKNLVGKFYSEINSKNIKDIHYVKIPLINGIISIKEIFDTLNFFKQNDHYAEQISKNAVKYYKEHLNKHKMFEYFLENI